MTTSFARRVGAVVVALTTALGGAVALAPSASALTVDVPYRCLISAFNVDYDFLQEIEVTVTTPTPINQGDPIVGTYDLPTSTPEGLPIPIENAVFNASPSLQVKAADDPTTQVVTLSTANTAPSTVAPYEPIPVDVPAAFSIPTTSYSAGDTIQIRPDVLTIDIVTADGGLGGGVITCTPETTGPAPIAANVLLLNAIPPNSSDFCTAYLGNLTGGPGCDTTQIAGGTITPGTLTQQALQTGGNPSATAIDLGTTPTSVVPVTLNGVMNDIVVTDSRGGAFQWSLTSQMTDFTAGANSIDAAALSVTPGCVATAAGSAAGAVAGGAAQNYGTAVTLCTGPSQIGDSGSTGGVWTVGGPLELAVPAFQSAGAYTAIMSITLA